MSEGDILNYAPPAPLSGPAIYGHTASLLEKSFASGEAGNQVFDEVPKAWGSAPGVRVDVGQGKDMTFPTQDLLGLLLLPRVFRDDAGTEWPQRVSEEPSSRAHVLELTKIFDGAINARGARAGGICPVREECFSELFDELIRQTTIHTPERGVLLLRLRDELRMTAAAYRMVYENNLSFGVRKAVNAEHLVRARKGKVTKLEDEISALKAEAREWENRAAGATAEYEQKSTLERLKRQEELSYLKDQAAELQSFLSSV